MAAKKRAARSAAARKAAKKGRQRAVGKKAAKSKSRKAGLSGRRTTSRKAATVKRKTNTQKVAATRRAGAVPPAPVIETYTCRRAELPSERKTQQRPVSLDRSQAVAAVGPSTGWVISNPWA